MRIGLLLCDFMPDEYVPIAGGYEDMFSTMLSECDISLISYEAYERRLPDRPDECDGYVISGSRASVYDDEQWIRDLEAFIREAVEASVPIFGVCFGLQVMAQALGGTVERFEGGWGIGVHTMTVGKQRPWMADSPHAVSLIMSHQDQVTVLPEDASLLGSSVHCENYLVEFTPIHVAIQGHPEFEPAFAERIYSNQDRDLGPLRETALASLEQQRDTETVVSWMCRILDAGNPSSGIH
ncbi:MAG: type 1 glutamine amidotransferase [bacterium]|nr:type 1 glutamine amidotransferase [bacterium]